MAFCKKICKERRETRKGWKYRWRINNKHQQREKKPRSATILEGIKYIIALGRDNMIFRYLFTKFYKLNIFKMKFR